MRGAEFIQTPRCGHTIVTCTFGTVMAQSPRAKNATSARAALREGPRSVETPALLSPAFGKSLRPATDRPFLAKSKPPPGRSGLSVALSVRPAQSGGPNPARFCRGQPPRSGAKGSLFPGRGARLRRAVGRSRLTAPVPFGRRCSRGVSRCGQTIGRGRRRVCCDRVRSARSDAAH